MIIPEFVKEYLNKCTNSKGNLHSISIKKYDTPELKEWISQYPDYKWIHIYHLMKLGLDDIPLCPICGSKVFNFYKGNIFCSANCSNSCIDKISKTKNTFINHYGFNNPSKSKEVQDKIKQTNLKKYGVKFPLQNKELYEKYKNTCLEKYSYTHPAKSKEVQDKIKQTNLQKHGTKYYLETQEFKEKSKKALLEKYGVDNISKHKETKLKSVYSYRKTYKKNYYNRFYKLLSTKNIELLDSKEDFINNTEHKYKCLSCNKVFLSKFTNIQVVHCLNCYSIFLSNKELDLYRWIFSLLLNSTIIQHDRSILNGKELDIYIPDKNLAIEFNGDYWHSEYYKDKNYHLDKTLKCQEKGIRLIHIFEHEWDSKRLIVESIIRNKLGLIENHIYARKCSISEISQRDYSNFLELNHIQGSIVSKYRYGLFYNRELVSVIGFGKSRFKKGEMELHRFCSKINTSVIGGFSKLISYFMNQNICSEFITYVDRSKFDAKGYFKIGFELINQIEPSYFYTKNGEVLSRYQCQKHKLAKLLENYSPSLSESDNMILNGYLKVYDCGTLKLIYKKNS